MEKCSYPGCEKIVDFVSKIHCRLEHQMEREEVFKRYGPPKSLNKRKNGIVIGSGKHLRKSGGRSIEEMQSV